MSGVARWDQIVFWTLAALAATLAGCGLHATPTAQQLADADYGPPPENYEELVRGAFSTVLFDPYSAVYQFIPPSQGWFSQYSAIQFGWRVCGTVNAKNRFGAYVSAMPFYFLFNHGRAVKTIFGNDGISRDMAIRACS